MFDFWKTWRGLFSCNTHFEIRRFAFLPTTYICALPLFLFDTDVLKK